jgi:hypothetical protein
MTKLANKLIVAVTAALLFLGAIDVTASSSRRAAEAEQAALDQACEEAREKILTVERAQLIDECVANKFPRSDRSGCERFYADHGNATAGGRAPLYMDLPECVVAHDNRQGR